MKKFFTKTILAVLFLSMTSGINAQTNLQGSVLYHNNPSKPIPSVELKLTSSNGIVVATTFTNGQGQFTFTNIPYGTYTISSSTTIPAGGINLTDSWMLMMYLLGFNNLTPIQALAADVDGDNQITWNDYFTIVIGWFLQGYPFPSGDWQFADKVVTFTGNLKDGTKIIGTSSGDLNGSYVPNITKDALTTVSLNNQLTSSTNQANINIASSQELTGFGLVLSFDNLQQVPTNVTSTLKGFNYSINENSVRVAWIAEDGKPINFEKGKTLFTLEGGQFNEKSISVLPESHAISTNGEILPQFGIDMAKPNFTNCTIYPNPTSNLLNINFTAAENQQYSVSILGQDGSQVMTTDYMSTIDGIQHISIDVARLAAGNYYYSIRNSYSNQPIFSGKFQIIR